MKRKPGPSSKELRNTGINPKYQARRFPGPPGGKPQPKPKRKGAKGGGGGR